ncbi:DNA adenine methylase [Flagellimonas sp. CMM7]|uniref:DNA adenine methylase n=1 Tax=Flagellimonas sp. CMM7 TaxID=2654676 RepID=UPI0013D41DF0|nr:DNA adenine methylase [Flagellimonas sp. CMM7]UII79328.1 DNA adenine methylase [Flagellimonas sp. CMM7]
MAQKYYSPLRYPGGKGKLLGFAKDLINSNELNGGSYSEPYAGGASIAIGLLIEDYVSEININDIDYGIYSFWNSILEDTDDFLRKLWSTKVSIEEWRKQVNIKQNQADYSQLDIGFSTFFLNRTNRSGMINAGVIGGINQNGNYKIDARFNKDELARRIKRIACHKEYINVYNQDAVEFITSTIRKNKTQGLIFLDPPYYNKGKKLYTNFYEHDDHLKIAETIVNSEHKHWIVTYDNTSEIEEMYTEVKKIAYSLKYSLNHQSKNGTELLFHSNDIVLPYHPNNTIKGYNQNAAS